MKHTPLDRRSFLKIGAFGVVGAIEFRPGRIQAAQSSAALQTVPAVPTWTTRAPMPSPRLALGVAATNGKIYAVGGTDSAANPYFDALEIFDPSLNVWTTGAPMPTPRWGLAATAVGGRVYAIGGFLGHDGYRDTVEAYDPVANSWQPKASLSTPRMQHAAIAGNDGKIYVIGGWRNENLRSLEVYDPLTNLWTSGASMPTGRYGPGVAQAPNGKIYVIGGTINTGPELDVVEAYDPQSDSWEICEPLPTARGQLIAATGLDGKVYAIGGWQVYGTVYATVECFDPVSGSWASAPSMSTARYSLSGVRGDNGRIYAIGGISGIPPGSFTAYGTVEELNLNLPAPVYAADVRPPIRGDGQSVFKASRGTLPVKFELTVNGEPTCALPPATISVQRLVGSTYQPVTSASYVTAQNNGTAFDIGECEYHYQLAVRLLGPGRYQVDIRIASSVTGTAQFELK